MKTLLEEKEEWEVEQEIAECAEVTVRDIGGLLAASR